MTETAALKKPTMAVNKSNVSPENSASAEANRSFKMMLNKQVQDTHLQNKQVQEKQLQNKHIQNKQIQNKQIQDKQNQDKQNQVQQNQVKIPTAQDSSAKPDNAETVETANKNRQKESHLQHVINAKNHTKAITEAENPEALKLASKELTDSIKSTQNAKLSLAVKGDDAKSEEAATHAADANLAATESILAILPPILLENKQAISSTVATNADLSSTADGAAQKQRALGAQISNVALNNALSQGKNNNTADNDAHDLKETAEGKLLRATKPMDADESANSKLALNAAKEGASKDFAIKDIAVKDMITPASNQPAVQIKAAEAVQQAGSSNVINAYPGKTGWDQAISQKVVWMLGASEQSATLSLNPPELGPLKVVIHVHNDKADTTFMSDNAEVRQALQDGMDNLRGKLNESGIQLGQANVSSGGQMQQQFQQASQKNGMGSQLNNNNASASPLESTNNPRTIVRVANGLVDTFA